MADSDTPEPAQIYGCTIELDREDDGRWIAEVMEWPGCLAYGDTRLGAVRRVLEILDQVRADKEAAEVANHDR